MATTEANIQFRKGMYEKYLALQTKDPNTIYFCEDTKQIFIGDAEYAANEIAFTGTTAEVEQAIADGSIQEGDIVNITDDATLRDITLIATEDELNANTSTGKTVDAMLVKDINSKLCDCWIDFTDAEGNPTTEPYIHWLAEEEEASE